MIMSRLRMSLVAAALTLFVAVPLLPEDAEAQDRARWRVLVANMKPVDDTRERFGERVSDRLRDLIDVPTHVAMSGRETDRAARDYDMRLRNLDCAFALQLAIQIDVPLIFCGEYETVDGEVEFLGKFITAPSGEEFEAGPHRVPAGEERRAAELIMEDFEITRQTVQNIAFCGSEYRSQNWDQALDYCTRAVELAPDSRDARFALARSYMEVERYEESLEQFQILLDERPDDDRYLENAGWVAAQLEQRDLARDYYHRYLEINPDDARVRLNVAWELAQIGDYYGAMTLVEEGVERDPEHVDLHEAYGLYAFRAARNLQDELAMRPVQQDSDAPSLDPEVAELFRAAVASLERVVEARGDEARPSHVVNSMRAYIQLGEVDEAIRFGERGTEIFPEDPQIWSQLGDARNRAGDTDGALEALERVEEINPNFPNLRARMGNFLLVADRIDEAIEAVHAAHEAQEQAPDALAGILLRDGFQRIQREEYEPGIRLVEAAKELPVSDGFHSQASFFHAFGLLQRADRLQRPQTLETAERTLPMFQQVLELLEDGRAWAEETPGTNFQQIREAAERFIEIQEAVIQRERRRR